MNKNNFLIVSNIIFIAINGPLNSRPQKHYNTTGVVDYLLATKNCKISLKNS